MAWRPVVPLRQGGAAGRWSCGPRVRAHGRQKNPLQLRGSMWQEEPVPRTPWTPGRGPPGSGRGQPQPAGWGRPRSPPRGGGPSPQGLRRGPPGGRSGQRLGQRLEGEPRLLGGGEPRGRALRDCGSLGEGLHAAPSERAGAVFQRHPVRPGGGGPGWGVTLVLRVGGGRLTGTLLQSIPREAGDCWRNRLGGILGAAAAGAPAGSLGGVTTRLTSSSCVRPMRPASSRHRSSSGAP